MKDSNVQIFSINYSEVFNQRIRLFVKIENGVHNFYLKYELFEIKFMEVSGIKFHDIEDKRINTDVDLYDRHIDDIEEFMDDAAKELKSIIKTSIFCAKKNSTKCAMYKVKYDYKTFSIEDIQIVDIIVEEVE